MVAARIDAARWSTFSTGCASHFAQRLGIAQEHAYDHRIVPVVLFFEHGQEMLVARFGLGRVIPLIVELQRLVNGAAKSMLSRP